MTRADPVIGAGLTIAFLLMTWSSTGLTYSTEFAPGPGFAPFWLGVVGAGISAYVAARGVGAREGVAVPRAGLVRLAAALAGLVVAMVAVPSVGLALALAAYLLFLTLAIERMPLASAVATSLGTTLLVYVVFARLLDVPFPAGPLGF